MQRGSEIAGEQPNTLFVEAEAWEYDELIKRSPEHFLMHARPGKLQEIEDHEIPNDLTVLSPFIHSKVDAGQLDRLEDLKLITTRSTGFDHIDLAACKRRGIVVCNVPAYGENTVAEHTFALLLALTRKIHRCYERTIRGDFSIEGLRGVDLYGKTFGCLGAGQIGWRVLRIAAGFGLKMLAFDVHKDPKLARRIGFEYVTFDELLRRSDVLSIHAPYNDHTHHLIDAAAIAKMPPGAIIVNTARGGIIEAQALVDALQSGRLGGAALDVIEAETDIGEEAEILSSGYDFDTLRTIVRNHALLKMPNVIITPHVAFNSEQAVSRIIDTTVQNIHTFFAGRPQNVVSGAPAPAGDYPGKAIDDLTYLEQMYQAGLKNYSDAIGVHPSGFNVPPDADWQTWSDPSASFRGPADNHHHSWAFRGTMEGARNIMVVYGDSSKRLWPTEFGWASTEGMGVGPDPGYGYAADNTEAEQAQFLVRAYEIAKNWGWVGPMFTWNLNYWRVSGVGDEKAKFGIVRGDWSGRPAYAALRDMPK